MYDVPYINDISETLALHLHGNIKVVATLVKSEGAMFQDAKTDVTTQRV